MGIIHKLAPSTVLKIAAGEVIERPSCVVKELMENAIDSGATLIKLKILAGGLDLIEVSDNGLGIAFEDLPLALEPHATSKLQTDEDLFKLFSRGFRGEALASISSVSHFELSSRHKDQADAFKITQEGDQRSSPEPTAHERGTTLKVKNLFFNTPTRRKFLKSKTSEKSSIEKTFKKMCLSLPHIAFQFFSDGKKIYDCPIVPTLKDRVRDVFGKELSSKLLEVSLQNAAYEVQGVISNREITFSRPTELWFFVNGRPVLDKTLQAAVMEGYRTALMEHRFPFVLINLTLPPDHIDINIHPRKNEVRFLYGSDVFKVVSKAIAMALGQQVAHTSFAEPWVPAPATNGDSSQTLQNQTVPWTPPLYSNEHALTASMHAADLEQRFQNTFPPAFPHVENFFSRLTYVTSIDHTYLVCSSASSLVIIDQHAAHERVLFEKIKQKHLGKPLSQKLIAPLTLRVSHAQAETLEKQLEFFVSLGFDIEHFGDQDFLVHAVPQMLRDQNPLNLILDTLQDLNFEKKTLSFENHIDRMCSTLACHSAVRAHDVLSPLEVSELLKQMDETRLSSYCPHGRPTFIEFSVSHLEKLFNRV